MTASDSRPISERPMTDAETADEVCVTCGHGDSDHVPLGCLRCSKSALAEGGIKDGDEGRIIHPFTPAPRPTNAETADEPCADCERVQEQYDAEDSPSLLCSLHAAEMAAPRPLEPTAPPSEEWARRAEFGAGTDCGWARWSDGKSRSERIPLSLERAIGARAVREAQEGK